MKKQYAKNMIDFLQNSPCSFLAVKNCENKLKEKGFVCLNNKEKWEVEEGGKYYITRNDSTLISFIVGKEANKTGFRMIGSHTDSPSFVIKPNCEIKVNDRYLKFNTEGYGGMILSTWLDRPLSMAGRVILKGENIFKPTTKMIDFKKPIAIIPNLAIHLNRDINEGHKYSKQREMLPIVSLTGEDFNEKGYIYKLIANEINVKEEDILDYELFLYEAEKGSIIGIKDEFISCSRLDDLMMVYNSLEAFLKYEESKNYNGIKVLYLADNEEVGSHTGQGADGALLRDTLKRLCLSLFDDEEAFYSMAEKSVFISADLAHGLHPNYIDKHDLTNKPILNDGVCLKYSANQKYSTTGVCAGIFDGLCKEANISYQKFVNHSDVVGGSTIGAMLASQFNITVIDFGVCILGMHSIRELASVKDTYDCYKLFTKFYEL
ncbi:M18 family aminopeptidase [[Clostridium] colinum]|uniref:M18 family aminopeptidase n=1 Tax=[Clostridium] colinum TaxID=36835 RepID=UPI0020252A9E|nr:M18 family aminopeptidase [[Clostridium] colinum]